MTTPPTAPANDDSEAFYWLTMARRILSGEIEPQDARRLLRDAAPACTAAKTHGATQPLHPSF